MPPRCGNHAVKAVATPSSTSESNPNTCSRMMIMMKITRKARNPGISRTVCNNHTAVEIGNFDHEIVQQRVTGVKCNRHGHYHKATRLADATGRACASSIFT